VTDLWCQTSARGWGASAELTNFLLDFGKALVEAEGLHAFLASREGTPNTAGALRCRQGVALFAGASTVPEARNQGAQRALLAARIQLARAQRCDLAMMCAAPGSASEPNAERQGFRVAYTRTQWQLAAGIRRNTA